jgi:hypothetical protein
VRAAMQAGLDALKNSVPQDCFKEDGRWFRNLGEYIGLYEVSEYAEKLEAIAQLEAALADVDAIREHAQDLIDELDAYPEQLVPINRLSHTCRMLREALVKVEGK